MERQNGLNYLNGTSILKPINESVTNSRRGMKRIGYLIVFLFCNTFMYGQNIEFGRYSLCYDTYWRCHFENLLDLMADSTYRFTYLDDTQMKKTGGTWKIDSCYLVLTPFIIPDTIKITEIFEYENTSSKTNIIRLSEYFKRIKDMEVTFFRGGEICLLKTDDMGEIRYTGDVADSIAFTIKGRQLAVKSQRKASPSVMEITIETNHKDLVYACLGTNKILIRNGRMVVTYQEGKDETLKTEYFRRVRF